MTFCDFDGILLPLLGDTEKDWPNIIRLILYLSLLVWTFLAIGIISDVFMGGIEKVTSAKRRKMDQMTGKMRTHYVWNATVANLSLMALGSSAPEILLSLIEIGFDNMFLGDLGAGTIVGSAAFNLLVISAVCVCAIPDGEIRYIKQTKVYFVTAFFSVFAYLWLMFILMVTSPNVCEIWEAVVTLLFCPTFVFLAYLADRGVFDRGNKYEEEGTKSTTSAVSMDMTDDELADIEAEIRKEHGQDLSDAQVTKIMQVQYMGKRSRAYYRHAAMQEHLHRHHVKIEKQGPPDLAIQDVITSDDIEQEKKTRRMEVGFASKKYAFGENCGNAELTVVRTGAVNVKGCVKYKTRDGTAKAGQDYTMQEGTLVFDVKETEKTISIPVIDDVAFEADEEFYVDLLEPTCEESGCVVAVNEEYKSVTVVVIDDDEPGVLKHKIEEIVLKEEGHDQTINVVVERVNGLRGAVSCSYFTEDHSAKAGLDYDKAEGDLNFENGQTSAMISVAVKTRNGRLGQQEFHIILKDPKGTQFDKTTDGGEDNCICTVLIKGRGDKTQGNVIAGMRDRIVSANNVMGNKNWIEQFRSAIFDVIEDDDELEEGDEPPKPGAMDWFMHIITMPWKLLFAFCPPADYCGGWACFCGALCMIAIVTAIVGDLANLVGCCLGIKAEITAITFVALGTSLPDTFASMTAAQMDPYADASIGNITGSNSVNVFMGIGLSWAMAAFYWQTGKPSGAWFNNLLNYKGYEKSVQKNILDSSGCKPCIGLCVPDVVGFPWKCDSAVFMAPAGSIWFNLMVFCLNAICALWHLEGRRLKFGGELGGPKKGAMGQYFSGVFLVSQWFIYIIASSIYAISVGKDDNKDWGKFIAG